MLYVESNEFVHHMLEAKTIGVFVQGLSLEFLAGLLFSNDDRSHSSLLFFFSVSVSEFYSSLYLYSVRQIPNK